MVELHPIVYTRPFCKDDDFRFFSRPKSLVGDAYFVGRMRNVLSTENYRGGISGKRWHVLRTKSSIVIGFATQEFERRDGYGRGLRGYYGFEMSLSDFCLPDDSLFCALDEKIVEPLFHEKNLQERDFGIIQGTPFDDPKLYHRILDVKIGREFNTHDADVVNYIPCDVDVHELLKEAIVCASRHERFECVIGLNKRKHAEESRVLNCVCHEQPTALKVRVKERCSETTVKNGSPIPPDATFKKEEFICEENPRTKESRQAKGLLRRGVEYVERGIESLQSWSFRRQSNCPRKSEANSVSPQERMDCGDMLPLTASTADTFHSKPVAKSMAALHGRGFNVKQPQSSTPIKTAEATEPRNVPEPQDKTELADIMADLTSLYVQCCKNEEGVDVRDGLASILRKHGATQISGDTKFDPVRHKEIESSTQNGDSYISETLVPGWMYGGRVLEKALVKCVEKPSYASDLSTKVVNHDELMQEA